MEVFCPRVRFRRVTRRGTIWFTEALFPGYLFARFDRWRLQRAVAHARSVISIVRFGDEVPSIPGAALAQLQEQMSGEECKIIIPEVQEGDNVIVAHGLFRGLASVVTSVMPAKDRVRVLLDFLGECREVEVHRDQVLPDRSHFLTA